MFCPKCGNRLVQIDEDLTCVQGQMLLSDDLERRLTECFISRVVKPTELRLSYLVGGEWYCPGCGVSIVEEDGIVRCGQCGLPLNEFIYSLVELHPHKR